MGAPIKESDTAEEHSILTSDSYSYTQATCTLRLSNTPTILTRAHTRALQPAAMAFVSYGFVFARVRVRVALKWPASEPTLMILVVLKKTESSSSFVTSVWALVRVSLVRVASPSKISDLEFQ